VGVLLTQLSPASYRTGAAAVAFLVLVGLATRWTVALGAAPVVWLGIVGQISEEFSAVPSRPDAIGAAVMAGSLAAVVWALRRWEADRRRAREEATARWRNERRLNALVELAHHLASVGTRTALHAAVERNVPAAAGSTGAILVVQVGDGIEFPAVSGHDPAWFPSSRTLPAAGSPAADVLHTGRAVFCSSAAELCARYPELADFVTRSRQHAWAALPVSGVGALVLTWDLEQVFSRAQQAFLETIANLLAAAAERIRVVERTQLERFVAAFDAMLDAVGIHRAVRDSSGAVVDLEIEYLNPAAVTIGSRADLIGRRMSEIWPDNPMLMSYVRVVETGEPFVLEDVDVATLDRPTSEAEAVSIRASRLDDERVVIVVRDVGERARLLREIQEANEMFAVAEQLAHVGSWRYDARADRVDWSSELYRIVGVPEGTVPIRPVNGSLFGYEHPDDQGVVEAAVHRAIAAREPFTFEMRIVRQDDGEVRDVATTGIIRVDDDGNITGVWGATQDITDWRRAERSRRAALSALADQREVVAALQRVILPASLPDVPGAQLSAHYRPAALSSAVGGDWYDAFVAPDGRVVLVIGDVAGHGVECAALANELRVAVRVRVRDGMEPGAIIQVLDAELDEGFVTCWLATYDPPTRCLSVANAGHPPALLARRGSAQQVTAYTVPPLGTHAARDVTQHVVRLERGDLLVLYTDGLIERRGEHFDDGLARLAVRAPIVGGVPDPALTLVEELAPHAEDDVCVVTMRVE